MSKPFLSICIPSYNRPQTLLRLLRTIDTKADDVQIVICEDHAPKRLEVRAAVDEFKAETKYEVKYVENEVNKGYDWNLRDFITTADGEYIVFCDDDGAFVKGALDKLIAFLKEHPELGYVLRRTRYPERGDDMRYFPGTRFFEPGVETYQMLYRKSVIVAGFTFKRELAIDTMTDRFDGSLLYQLYILAEICLKHPSAYFDETITEKLPGETEFYFGSSEKEKGLYEPKKISVRGQMNFMNSFIKIAQYIDDKYGLHSVKYVKKDMSKYSYPVLAWMMRKSRFAMLGVAWEYIKGGMGTSIYFYVYVFALLLFGTKFCDKMIVRIKKKLGHTPSL